MQLGVPQPAYKMYPFDRGWRIIRYVWRNIWAKTGATTQPWFDWADARSHEASMSSSRIAWWWLTCLAIGARIGGASQYATCTAFVAVFAAIQVVMLAVWSVIVMIPVVVITIVTWIYTRIYGIFYRCPDCHHAMPIPTFICPTCTTPHTRLWPSVYGVFHHTCNHNGCDTKLATLEVLGRRNLMRVCPTCGHPINVAVGWGTNLHIPIIGGRSSGKTAYLVEATNELIHTYAEPRNIAISFTDTAHQNTFDARITRMQRGITLDPTSEIVPQAYNLLIKRPGRGVPYTTYIYDAAGEAFNQTATAGQQKYYEYVHGTIFMIDPSSLPGMRRNHAQEIEQAKDTLRPTTLEPMTAYANMITTYENSVGLKPNQMFPYPIAVVVSKADALGLEDQIGGAAAEALMARDSRILLKEDAISMLVRQFLVDNDLDNLVRAIELQFTNVKYFSCSALGRAPTVGNSSAFEPVRVTDPLVWLLGSEGAVNSLGERRKAVDALQKQRSKSLGGVRAMGYYYMGSLRPLDPEENPNGLTTLPSL